MNRKQIAVLWLGIIAFVLMGLFPPWVSPLNYLGGKGWVDKGYKLLFTPPRGMKLGEERTLILGASIDVPCLCVQWSMVAVVTGGLIVTFGKRR